MAGPDGDRRGEGQAGAADRQSRELTATYWWQFGETDAELYEAIRGLDRVLGHLAESASIVAFAFLPAGLVFAQHAGRVCRFSRSQLFCVLQSRAHEIWARFFGSSMKDDLRYTPSDCFETFPFPEDWETRPDPRSGRPGVLRLPRRLMVRNNEGLTKTYNRFHDPDERDPDILKLRELHAAMDRAVLDAYGWTDTPADLRVPPRLRGRRGRSRQASRRKKPWRYRWPDDVRDEVLARLLELNAERAKKSASPASTPNTAQLPKQRNARPSPDQESPVRRLLSLWSCSSTLKRRNDRCPPGRAYCRSLHCGHLWSP